MIAGLFPLLLIAGLVAGVVWLSKRTGPAGSGSGLRYIVTAFFTLATGIIAAVGVAQLLALAFERGDVIAGRPATEVARAIALTVVGLPAFVALWRYLIRLVEQADGSTVVWGLYLTLATAVFGIGTVVGLGVGLTWALGWSDVGAGALATGISWGVMSGWHEWHRVSVVRPVVLADLAPSVGSAIGLVTGAVGLGMVFVALLNRAYQTIVEVSVSQPGLGEQVGEGAVWLVLGTGVWWWMWLHDAARREPSVARSLYLLVPGAAGGAVAALAGAGALLFTVLQHFLGDGASAAAVQFEEVPTMLTAIALGFVVWRYHRSVELSRSESLESEIGYSYRYLLGGLSLLAAAAGFGVAVNGLLAASTPAVVGEGGIDLLLGGLSALAVGLPLWWFTWRPHQAPTDREAISRSRRSYLTVLAGVGGVAALVSLILVVYRVLESILEGDSFALLVDRSRGPFGVLVATALVAAYHVVTWRRERRQTPEAEHPILRRVTVLTTRTGNGLRTLDKDLGIPMVTMHSSGIGRVVDEAEVAGYLRGLDAPEAMVIEEEHGYRVIEITHA